MVTNLDAITGLVSFNSVASIFQNRRDKQSGVNVAAGVGGKVRYREVILFERETGTSSWLLNMDVVWRRRAYRGAFSIPQKYLHIRHAASN